MHAWHERLSFVNSHVTRHHHIPVALGSGAAKLTDEIACLLWSWKADCNDLIGLVDMFGSYVSFCTDMGTEIGAQSYRLQRVRDLLPVWMVHALQPIEGPDDAQEVWEPPQLARAAILCLFQTSCS